MLFLVYSRKPKLNERLTLKPVACSTSIEPLNVSFYSTYTCILHSVLVAVITKINLNNYSNNILLSPAIVSFSQAIYSNNSHGNAAIYQTEYRNSFT